MSTVVFHVMLAGLLAGGPAQARDRTPGRRHQ